jgi:hypothetical protein
MTGILAVRSSQVTLDPEKFPSYITLCFEPVGVGQANAVIVRSLKNRLNETIFFHRGSSAYL